MITRKELKLRLLTRVENLRRESEKHSNKYLHGLITGLKDVLKMLGYDDTIINNSDARLKEIERLRRI